MNASSETIRVLGTGLISLGLGLLLFVFTTLGWGDPFTRLLADRNQDTLATQLGADFGVDADAAALRPDPRLTRAQARRYWASLKAGEAGVKLRIPALGMNRVVVKGTGTEELKKGPGLYSHGSAYPGMGAPVGIAGHRTTYGAPFLNIDKLVLGDRIVLEGPYGTFEYRVTKTKIVTPKDWSILERGAGRPSAASAALRKLGFTYCAKGTGTCEHLVLTACHPKYSAARRLAVLAQLYRVTLPAGGRP